MQFLIFFFFLNLMQTIQQYSMVGHIRLGFNFRFRTSKILWTAVTTFNGARIALRLKQNVFSIIKQITLEKSLHVRKYIIPWVAIQ